jgi:hypothetical protein
VTANLRTLLIHRAARLQERPALTAPGWGTLTYFQFRNRIEGVAFGVMAGLDRPEGVFAATGTAWDWVGEVAAACCGLPWDLGGKPLDEAILGGACFNDEGGRQAYHDRERDVDASTRFQGNLTQGDLLERLQRLNRRLGWDHETRLELPLPALATAEARGALWSALFAGAHTVLVATADIGNWDVEHFRSLLSE